MNQLFSDIGFFKELTPQDVDIHQQDGTQNIKLNCNHNKPGLCMIYRDNCPHCVSMKPIFKRLATLMDMNNYFIGGMNTNNKDNQEIMRKLNIKYVPKMYVVYPGGSIKEFSGDSHNVDSLTSLLQSITIPQQTKKTVKKTKKQKSKRQKTKQRKSKRKKTKQKKSKKTKQRKSKRKKTKQRKSKKRN